MEGSVLSYRTCLKLRHLRLTKYEIEFFNLDKETYKQILARLVTLGKGSLEISWNGHQITVSKLCGVFCIDLPMTWSMAEAGDLSL